MISNILQLALAATALGYATIPTNTMPTDPIEKALTLEDALHELSLLMDSREAPEHETVEKIESAILKAMYEKLDVASGADLVSNTTTAKVEASDARRSMLEGEFTSRGGGSRTLGWDGGANQDNTEQLYRALASPAHRKALIQWTDYLTAVASISVSPSKANNFYTDAMALGNNQFKTGYLTAVFFQLGAIFPLWSGLPNWRPNTPTYLPTYKYDKDSDYATSQQQAESEWCGVKLSGNFDSYANGNSMPIPPVSDSFKPCPSTSTPTDSCEAPVAVFSANHGKKERSAADYDAVMGAIKEALPAGGVAFICEQEAALGGDVFSGSGMKSLYVKEDAAGGIWPIWRSWQKEYTRVQSLWVHGTSGWGGGWTLSTDGQQLAGDNDWGYSDASLHTGLNCGGILCNGNSKISIGTTVKMSKAGCQDVHVHLQCAHFPTKPLLENAALVTQAANTRPHAAHFLTGDLNIRSDFWQSHMWTRTLRAWEQSGVFGGYTGQPSVVKEALDTLETGEEYENMKMRWDWDVINNGWLDRTLTQVPWTQRYQIKLVRDVNFNAKYNWEADHAAVLQTYLVKRGL